MINLFDQEAILDITSGLVLSNERTYFGFSMNRMRSLLRSEGKLLPVYFVGSFMTEIPVRYGNDVFQPSLVYEIQENSKNFYAASLLYRYNDRLIAGVNYRSESIVGLTAGIRLENRYLISYTMERPMSSTNLDLGPSHEITIRYDLNMQYFRRVNPSNDTPIRTNTFRRSGG